MEPCSAAAAMKTENRTRDRGFAFPSARIRVGEDRFELSMWDCEPTVVVGLDVLGFPFIWMATSFDFAMTALGLALIVIVSARRTLVVTRQSSWVSSTILGVRYKIEPLGRRPHLEGGLVWDWSEISVTPSDESLKPALHDGDRAVLVSWGELRVSEEKDRDAAFIAEVANAEIARLHPG